MCLMYGSVVEDKGAMAATRDEGLCELQVYSDVKCGLVLIFSP